MMMRIQSLNTAGVQVFVEWLENPKGDAPIFLLTDSRYCDEIQAEYLLDFDRDFSTSYDLGKYLHEDVFGDVNDVVGLTAASGMWAWISLALIRNLLKRGNAKPLGIPHYVERAGTQGRRLGYRLIVRTAWRLLRIHGEMAQVALGSKRSPWGEMAEQMTSRQEIFSHKSFWAVAFRLYRTRTGELRSGATTQRPASARKDPKNVAGRGGVRRLPATFRQFDRTFLTRAMSMEQMLEVLPAEYKKWVVQAE